MRKLRCCRRTEAACVPDCLLLVVLPQYEPKKDAKGMLRTPGATEFFRIMNEEIQVRARAVVWIYIRVTDK